MAKKCEPPISEKSLKSALHLTNELLKKQAEYKDVLDKNALQNLLAYLNNTPTNIDSINDLLTQINAEIAIMTSRNITTAEQQIKELNTCIETLKAESPELTQITKEIKKKKEEIASLDNEIKQSSEELKLVLVEITEKNTIIINNTERLETIGNEIDLICDKYDEVSLSFLISGLKKSCEEKYSFDDINAILDETDSQTIRILINNYIKLENELEQAYERRRVLEKSRIDQARKVNSENKNRDDKRKALQVAIEKLEATKTKLETEINTKNREEIKRLQTELASKTQALDAAKNSFREKQLNKKAEFSFKIQNLIQPPI